MEARTVVSAGSIAPRAYASEEVEEGQDQLQFDLYNLLALDHQAVDTAEFEGNKEEYMQERAQDATQRLINKLFALEYENSDAGPLAMLPEGTTRLPREKRIPDAKPETKWEKFAKEKGILKRKRERMVWDETFQEWRPSWGYKRANNGNLDMGIVEVKAGKDIYEDPWGKAMHEKKERVKKNLRQQQDNLKRAGKAGAKSKMPIGIPVELADAEPKQKKRGKEKTVETLRAVQFSTASLGRFDKAVEGEPERKKKGVRRAFRPVVGALADEQDAARKALRSIAVNQEKKAKKVTNSLDQYEGILPDAGPQFKAKKTKAPSTKMRKRKN